MLNCMKHYKVTSLEKIVSEMWDFYIKHCENLKGS